MRMRGESILSSSHVRLLFFQDKDRVEVFVLWLVQGRIITVGGRLIGLRYGLQADFFSCFLPPPAVRRSRDMAETGKRRGVPMSSSNSEGLFVVAGNLSCQTELSPERPGFDK